MRVFVCVFLCVCVCLPGVYNARCYEMSGKHRKEGRKEGRKKERKDNMV